MPDDHVTETTQSSLSDPTVTPADVAEAAHDLLTLDELTIRVGMSVRNIRFYTTKGLVQPPIRRGRSGYYSADHVARLELVQELQGHGFTLAAIEKYLAQIPEETTADELALTRTMLAPWMSEQPIEMTRDELETRAGRELSDDDLATLEALGIVIPGQGSSYRVALSQLTVGTGLLELGYPVEAAVAAHELYRRHGQELADELYELFRRMVWPAYRESGMTPDRLAEVVERLKPLSVTSLVSAYEAAMDERKREGIKRRTT